MSEVLVDIGGETFALKCTLDAFRSIPAALGGFVGTFGNLANADVNTCVYIVAVATGKKNDFAEHERIAGLMFKDGLDGQMFDKLTSYVKLLQNGGKVREAAGGGDPGK